MPLTIVGSELVSETSLSDQPAKAQPLAWQEAEGVAVIVDKSMVLTYELVVAQVPVPGLYVMVYLVAGSYVTVIY